MLKFNSITHFIDASSSRQSAHLNRSQMCSLRGRNRPKGRIDSPLDISNIDIMLLLLHNKLWLKFCATACVRRLPDEWMAQYLGCGWTFRRDYVEHVSQEIFCFIRNLTPPSSFQINFARSNSRQNCFWRVVGCARKWRLPVQHNVQ